jgi:hypothetical protein
MVAEINDLETGVKLLAVLLTVVSKIVGVAALGYIAKKVLVEREYRADGQDFQGACLSPKNIFATAARD